MTHDATTAPPTNPRAILSLLSVNCGSAAVAPHENARTESNKKRISWRREVDVNKDEQVKKEGASPRPKLNTINNDMRTMKIGRNIEGIPTINGKKCKKRCE